MLPFSVVRYAGVLVAQLFRCDCPPVTVKISNVNVLHTKQTGFALTCRSTNKSMKMMLHVGGRRTVH